jgi:hypothetical protein
MYNLSTTNGNFTFDLLNNVKNILQGTGMSYVWLSQNVPNIYWLKNQVKLILIDQYKQSWQIATKKSSKGEYYIMYKDVLRLEPYLLELPYKFRIWITRLRTANHKLPIETGRWQNIDKENRICTFCNTAICDELHFLLFCPSLNKQRSAILPQYFCKYPTIDKCIYIMKCDYGPLLVKLSKYIKQGLCLL